MSVQSTNNLITMLSLLDIQQLSAFFLECRPTYIILLRMLTSKSLLIEVALHLLSRHPSSLLLGLLCRRLFLLHL